MDISGKSSKEESDLDRLKLDLDREKLKVEQENFKRQQITEISKAIITGISIIVPIYIAYITLIYNLQIEETRANQSQKLLEESTRSNFLLKATEIVMNAKTTNETKNRAFAMKILFPDYLPKDFGDSFLSFEAGNNSYDGEVIYGDLLIQDNKNNFFNLTNSGIKIHIFYDINKSGFKIKDISNIRISNLTINGKNMSGLRIKDNDDIVIKKLTKDIESLKSNTLKPAICFNS